MQSILNRLLFGRRVFFVYRDNKRFAGHNKWSNIKHIKAENDTKKMLLFNNLRQQMKVAIEEGGSIKPDDNPRLTQIIERARKLNMPITSINSFLEKMKSRGEKTETGIIELRGLNGYVILVQYYTSNVKMFKLELFHKIKKTSAKVTNSSVRNMFTHIGYIVAEKECNIDCAMDDAINVGAEDVLELEEDGKKYFQFKCDPNLLNKTKGLLKGCQYNVLSAEEDFIPHSLLQLDEVNLEAVNQIRDKVLSIEDVSNIFDNIE